MELDLVDRWDDLRLRVVVQSLKVADTKVGDTNVPDLAGGRQLLHLVPCVHVIPVWNTLLEIIGVGGGWPVHEVKVNVVDTEMLQGGVNALRDTVVPWVVEFGGKPDLLARNSRVLDSFANLSLVTVGKSCVDVAVAGAEGVFDCFLDLSWR